MGRIIFEENIDKNRKICYTYDENGNILTKSVDGAVTAYRYQEGTDRLLSFGNESFAYDAMGNPTTYRGMTCTWEKGRQLKSIASTGGTATYSYDGNGLRTSKTVGSETTSFVYENGKLLRQSGSETIDFIYGSEGVIGFKVGTANYLYRKNLFGDVTEIYNEAGTLVGKYSYTAFGVCSVDLDTNGIATENPIRYRGYYYDDETELYYLKSRYYDPEVGRFITIDDLSYLNPESINGLNLYAYCGNNPVMRVDPDGTAFLWLAVLALLLFTPIGGIAAQTVVSTLSYIGMAVASIWDKEIRADMNAIGWNPFNSDEIATLNSSKVSFYKGVPVFRTASGGRSGSFGAIFLKKGSKIDTLRHERGHNWQLMMMGIGTYMITVGIPSPLMLGPWAGAGDYYGAPWETLADILGGVKSRTYNKEEITRAWLYYIVSMLNPFAAYFFLLWK